MKKFTLYCLLFFSVQVYAQYIPLHQDYTMVYDLIDELANEGIIDVTSVVKPYSREFIADALKEARRGHRISSRMKAEVEFYLNEFALEQNTLPHSKIPIVNTSEATWSVDDPSFRYYGGDFKSKISALGGGNAYYNKNGLTYKRYVGVDFQGYIGKHFSIYANFRDVVQPDNLLANRQHYNVSTKSPFTGADTLVQTPGYISNMMGGAYKINGTGGGDYSEMRGGVYYSWKWGHIGLAKDHITFGDAYNGENIISDNTPSFPFIKLNIRPARWIELNYIHASLTSMVIDSTEYYEENTGDKKYWYKKKYMAANMVTLKPFPKFAFSVGNSIVYAEDQMRAAYLIPLMFYKSVDHTLTRDQTENQNSQVFANLSIRNIKHLHLYGSLYIDEYSHTRLKNEQTNPISYKAGFRLSNFPLRNLGLTAEYTRNEILTYKHSIPATDYTSNGYLLGSYLGDNAQEIYVAIDTKPIARLHAKLSFTQAKKGNEYYYIRDNVIETISEPFLKDVVWTNNTISFQAVYELINNLYTSFQIDLSSINSKSISGELTPTELWTTADQYLDLYTPKYLQGDNLTFSVGINYGF